jgi:prevent-host-death family protein
MRTVTLKEAAADLPRLVERAAAGEPFAIAVAGRPVVEVVPYAAPGAAAGEGAARRFGFLAGEIEVPDDFDEMGRAEIEAVFAGRAGG